MIHLPVFGLKGWYKIKEICYSKFDVDFQVYRIYVVKLHITLPIIISIVVLLSLS